MKMGLIYTPIHNSILYLVQAKLFPFSVSSVQKTSLTKHLDKKIKDFQCFEISHSVHQAVSLPQENGDPDVYPKQWENNVTAHSLLGDGG